MDKSAGLQPLARVAWWSRAVAIGAAILRLVGAFALCVVAMADTKERLLQSYKAAVTAHQAHDLDVALTHYRECLAIQPIPAVLNNVAAILLSRGEKSGAEDSWRHAVRVKPDYAEAHYNLAVLLSESGDGERLGEASTHCELALEHKEGYVQAHHLMGNIRMSQGEQAVAADWYARAEALAAGVAHTSASSAASANSSTEGATSTTAAAASSHRWDGVEPGHVRTLRLPDGHEWVMTTLSMRPLAFMVRGFLNDSECERLIELARPKLKHSLLMGNASASERTSESVFLSAAEDGLLRELQGRLAALSQLPAAQVATSEDLQVVHYSQGATFGMHHDSSAFLPRLLTAFYYLNGVEDGGETAFPAADGAMSPNEALALTDPAAAGAGLLVKPEKGAALMWYNHADDGSIDPFAVHSGCRVLAGEKWGANHWVRVASARPTAQSGLSSSASASSTDGRGGKGERSDAGGDAGGEAANGDDAEDASSSADAEGKNAAKNRKKREKAAAKRRAAATSGTAEPQPDVEESPSDPGAAEPIS